MIIEADFSGIIYMVNVTEGDHVAVGDLLYRGEAMKIIRDTYSDVCGLVTGVSMIPGQVVNEGDELLEILVLPEGN